MHCATDDVMTAYAGSDAAASRRVCRRLESAGHRGRLAAALFRAQKASARAKRYRGGPGYGRHSFRDLAYDRKGQQLEAVCRLLSEVPVGLEWGWGEDPSQPWARWVLYLDLPSGQVSFHSAVRYGGPDYPGQWDGETASESRILAYCRKVYEAAGE